MPASIGWQAQHAAEASGTAAAARQARTSCAAAARPTCMHNGRKTTLRSACGACLQALRLVWGHEHGRPTGCGRQLWARLGNRDGHIRLHHQAVGGQPTLLLALGTASARLLRRLPRYGLGRGSSGGGASGCHRLDGAAAGGGGGLQGRGRRHGVTWGMLTGRAWAGGLHPSLLCLPTSRRPCGALRQAPMRCLQPGAAPQLVYSWSGRGCAPQGGGVAWREWHSFRALLSTVASLMVHGRPAENERA